MSTLAIARGDTYGAPKPGVANLGGTIVARNCRGTQLLP